jgi:hypothetical protein
VSGLAPRRDGLAELSQRYRYVVASVYIDPPTLMLDHVPVEDRTEGLEADGQTQVSQRSSSSSAAISSAGSRR